MSSPQKARGGPEKKRAGNCDVGKCRCCFTQARVPNDREVFKQFANF